jgi:hypothetical protein
MVTHTTVPSPSQIVAVGQELTIFKLGSEFATEVRSKLADLGDETQQAFKDEFLTHAFLLPVAFRFCSMSEQYCGIGGGRFDKVTNLMKSKRNIPNHEPGPFPEALFRQWFAECK